MGGNCNNSEPALVYAAGSQVCSFGRNLENRYYNTMKLIEKIIDKIDDNLNPIVVKELRQAVQSRFVVSLLMLMLIVLMSVMVFFALFSISEKASAGIISKGRDAFGILFGVFVFSSMLFVPPYTAFRMFTERSGDNMDLVFISAVKPGAIIRGKLFAGMTITLLLFSVCLPFMCFTYLLRGVDLPSIFVILTMAFTAVAIVTQLALLVACQGWNRILRAVMGLALTALVVISSSIVIALSNYLLWTGVGSRLGTWDFWAEAAIVLIPAGFLSGLLYVLSVDEITPSSANRALGFRLYITVSGPLTGIISFISAFYSKNSAIQEWFIFFLFIMAVALVSAVCERDGQSLRVAISIPHGKIKRTAAFFFYSGSANGVAWAIIMAGLAFCAVIFDDLLFDRPIYSGHVIDYYYIPIGFFLYHYCLTLSGLLIRRKLLWKLIDTKHTWTVIIGLYAVSFIIPLITAIWRGLGNLPDMLLVGFINYAVMTGGNRPNLDIPVLWALIVTILSLPWFIKQVTGFAPPDNTNSPECKN
ncbi:MAG: hypothetical protein GY795_23830 [Desulfobacterales bacterium]|nr:hypothetical protein [Desulfobacterales bacterium]